MAVEAMQRGSTQSRGKSRGSTEKKKKGFRPDVQGLRMVAVVAVILDHFFGWPAGGFVGVDVFFVISGFLITSLLLREHAQNGRISFVGFYRRRLKRIAPAATVVIVAVVAVSFFLLIRSRAVATFWDGVWAFFFVANWNFAAQGTDYFQADAPPSPLRHFWSLSVEEQFYFVWPWVMLIILVVVIDRLKMSSRAALLTAGAIMGALTILSFVWSMLETQTAPTWAYFSTLSRAWELGIGALVAIFTASFARIPQWTRTPLSWIGIGGIVVSLFVVTADTAFPAPWALLPVAATAIVIIAGVGSQPRFIWPLTNPVSRWVGDLSYSLYLWHWPIIVLLPALLPDQDLVFYLIAVGLTLGLSALSYYVVEDPIRNSDWLEPMTKEEKKRRRRRRRSRQGLRGASAKTTIIGLSSIGGVAVVLVVLALAPRAVSTAPMQPVPDFGAAASEDPSASAAPEDPLQQQLREAVSASQWPALTPDIGTVADIRPVEDRSGCGAVSHTDPDTCTFGAGPRLAVVVGDSVANTWIATVREALENDGWTVRGLARAGCPMVDTDFNREGVVDTECGEHRRWVFDRIQELQPEVVVISGTEGKVSALSSGAEGNAAVSEWGAAAQRTYERLDDAGARVLVVSPMPLSPDPSECFRPVGGAPSDCLGTVKDLWKSVSAAESAAAASAGAKYVDTHEWFCYSDRCPAFAGTTLIRADNVHMTPDYSRLLGERLRPFLLGEAEG